MISGFDTAIFDMDGTLIDSMPYWRIGALEYLLAHGLPVPDEMLTGMMHRNNLVSLRIAMDFLKMEYDSDEAAREMFRRLSLHYEHDVRRKPGVKNFLTELKKRNIRCYIATATPKEYADIALERLELACFFEKVFDQTDFGMGKDDERYFPRLMKEIRTDTEHCVLFEDALYSMKTAKRSGMRVVAVEDRCMETDREQIIAIADRYIRSYEELLGQ